MQAIADQLFVGNRLTSGDLRCSNGIRIDLRNIHSPIIVFCSWGDDITPPQQALHWILDLYDHEDELVAAGQTIVYCLHHSIGHLGIFVSGKVATKEHDEFALADTYFIILSQDCDLLWEFEAKKGNGRHDLKLHRAGQAGLERFRREPQRALPRRVPQRARVPWFADGTADH